jgi:hypothetical protein
MTNYIPSQDYSLYTDSETGSAFTSIRGLARLAGVDEQPVRYWLKGAVDGTRTEAKVLTAGGLQGAVLISAKAAYGYILKQAFKGNTTAQATVETLGEAGLTVHIHNETGYQKADPVVDDILQKLRDVRQYTKTTHKLFMLTCNKNGFPQAKVHDYLTLGVAGMTAADARQLKAVLYGCEYSDVALDHYSDVELLRKAGLAKEKFCDFKKGVWQERALRAVNQVLSA